MDDQEQMNYIRKLERALTYVQALPGDGKMFSSTYNTICSMLFDNDLHETLWDEPVLSLASELFKQYAPSSARFQETVDTLKMRCETVRKINDLFFAILDNQSDEGEVKNRIAVMLETCADSLNLSVGWGNRLQDIRISRDTPSGRVASCLKYLTEELKIDFGNKLGSVYASLKALKNRERIGTANALLVNPQTNVGAVIPVLVIVQPGSDAVKNLALAKQDFEAAVERAVQCLKKESFLKPTDGVDFSLDVTDVQYSGSSIALPSAIAMCYSANGATIDPYTAFSGDINISDGGYVVRAVEGISCKIRAARTYGCRRVFLPRENQAEVEASDDESVRAVLINKVVEVLAALQIPEISTQGEGLDAKKMYFLQTFCREHGWQLSEPSEVQAGYQFCIAPPTPPTLKVTIYRTGTHVPRDHSNDRLNELLTGLNKLDETEIPIHNVNQVFPLQSVSLRRKIEKDLDRMGPVERHQEQYCDYSWRFEDGKEVLLVKQYSKGKLVLQGQAGDLHRRILEVITSHYNLEYPQAQMTTSNYLGGGGSANSKSSDDSLSKADGVAFPYIGTDESGKGDYFGPLVSAGVYVEEHCAKELIRCGVRDSKRLSDKQNLDLAQEVARICRGRYSVIEVPPERYNTLYEQFRREGKNLNSLLAWGHAKALEEILSRLNCEVAVADQFADERFILGKLQEKGKGIRLIQMHKAEQNIGVAAASVLARARFLEKLSKLSQKYGIDLHKGASNAVVQDARTFVAKYGKEALREVAKLHFKTTHQVTAK